ncbi:MAG: hypothetical protein ABSG83_19895 [Roseiarcus sp.]|jgi:hypothetical protein
MADEEDDFERVIYDIARNVARIAAALEGAVKAFESIAGAQQKLINPILNARVDPTRVHYQDDSPIRTVRSP